MLIEKGMYNSRNEAIRDALRIMYENHELKVSPEKKHAFNAKADEDPKEQDLLIFTCQKKGCSAVAILKTKL